MRLFLHSWIHKILFVAIVCLDSDRGWMAGWRNMQIFGYRMSLWAEHIGTVEECFTSPHSLECMRRVRDLGLLNWKQFVADDITEMRGHLLKYPVDVDKKGMVKPLPGFETFPDIGGNICGSFFGIQENLTIWNFFLDQFQHHFTIVISRRRSWIFFAYIF